MVYWFIATPIKGDANNTLNQINKDISNGSKNLAFAKKINLENKGNKFKLGNLDSLMSINDQLIKLDSQIEGSLKKIEKQYLDLKDENQQDKTKFNVQAEGNCEVEEYLFGKDSKGNNEQIRPRFEWEDKIYSRNQKLPVLVQLFQSKLAKAEAELRSKTLALQEVRVQKNNLEIKQGNLLVKDLADVLNDETVSPGDFNYSSNITTLVAIVPKDQKQNFLAKYEQHKLVIPGSARHFTKVSDDQFMLYRICLLNFNYDNEDKQSTVQDFLKFSRDTLKTTCREFTFDAETFKSRKKRRTELETDLKSKTTVLEKTCENTFGEIYKIYAHMKQLRLIVDLTMRFGPKEGENDNALTCIVRVKDGQERKIQQQLTNMFAESENRDMYGTKEELEDSEDFFPFVYVPVVHF